MTDSPELVTDNLKLELERVRKAPELDAGQRAQFAGQLEIALQDASRRIEEKVDRDLRAQEIKPSSTPSRSIASWSSISKRPISCWPASNRCSTSGNSARPKKRPTGPTILPPALRNTPEPGEADGHGYVADGGAARWATSRT